MKKIMALLAALMMVVALGFVTTNTSAFATEQECVPVAAYTETSDWVLESPGTGWYQVDERVVVDTPASDETVVDEEAYTEVIPGTPSQWWNWSPNHQQGPFDGPPAFPTDARGTWQGPHTNGGPAGTGTFDTGENGRSNWFHRNPAVPEQTIYHPAVTHVVHHDAVTHKEFKFALDHAAVVCPPDEPSTDSGEDVVETSSTSYECDNAFEVVTIVVTTTPWTQAEGEDKVFGEPVVNTTTEQVKHEVVPCDTDTPDMPDTPSTPNSPDTPQTVSHPKAPQDKPAQPKTVEVPTVIASGL